MDCDSCFIESCKACNHSCQNYKPVLEVKGQGDCKGSIDIQENQNVWMNVEKGKKLRSKIWEKEKSAIKAPKQKKESNIPCDCFKKIAKKQDASDKTRLDVKQEKKNPELFENCASPWNFFCTNWNNNRMERFHLCEEPIRNDHSDSDKFLTETVFELKEKVNFLFNIFKDYGEKLFTEDYDDQSETKSRGQGFGDIWQLYNLNKRLDAAEEGIEKLALILEELLKASSKKKAFFPDESMTYSDPLKFEEMTIPQRLNLLKSRNDMLLNFLKDFLKVGSVEEICSSQALLPKENEFKQTSPPSKLEYVEKNPAKELNRGEIIETLKKLRMQVSKTQDKKPQNYSEPTARTEKRGENALKYSGNKLEVISEQAELSLSNTSDSAKEDEIRGHNFKKVKEEFPEISEEAEETDLNICDLTTKLLAEEAMLKSSLDKVHFELFSKLNSTDKKSTKTNLSVENKTEISAKEENNNKCNAPENNFESSGEISCVYCETENVEKFKVKHTSFMSGKRTRHKEFEDKVKEKRNSVENISDTSCKLSDVFVKRAVEHQEPRNRSFHKVLHKNSYTVLATTSKATRNGYCLPEVPSSSREESKNEIRTKDQRPMTAPNFQSKTLSPSGLKPLVPEKSKKKNSGINNVRNKNKNLLSKKSFVQTS